MAYHSNTKKNKGIWLSLGKSILLFALILPLFITSTATQAGVVAFISGIFLSNGSLTTGIVVSFRAGF